MRVKQVYEAISVPLLGTYYLVGLECGHQTSVLGTLKGEYNARFATGIVKEGTEVGYCLQCNSDKLPA